MNELLKDIEVLEKIVEMMTVTFLMPYDVATMPKLNLTPLENVKSLIREKKTIAAQFESEFEPHLPYEE